MEEWWFQAKAFLFVFQKGTFFKVLRFSEEGLTIVENDRIIRKVIF